MTRRGLVLVAGAALLAACGGEEPATRTPPPAAPPSKPLRALSAHGDDSTPAAPAPEAAASLPPGHPPLDRGRASAGPEAGAVAGTVLLAPGLKSHLASTDSLFIIARSAKDRQILAVRKEQQVRLPYAFSISGADAMMEGTPFVGPFDITARLSKTGDAMPGPGDLEGTAKGVATGARGVSIVLDSVRQ